MDYDELVDAVEDYLEIHASQYEFINSPTATVNTVEVCHYNNLIC